MTPVSTVTRPMSMAEIKEKAKNLGINWANMKKTELIRAIQRAEGNNTCYGTTNGTCQWVACCWRSDCLKIKK
jgi:predicted metal-binding transcription factor (methanogenesis marker protein 9)